METKQLLIEAKASLNEHTWTRGSYVSERDGHAVYCALGAVLAAAGEVSQTLGGQLVANTNKLTSEPVIHAAVDALANCAVTQHHDLVGSHTQCVTLHDRSCQVTSFNDHSETTLEDVLSLFDCAIAKS